MVFACDAPPTSLIRGIPPGQTEEEKASGEKGEQNSQG